MRIVSPYSSKHGIHVQEKSYREMVWSSVCDHDIDVWRMAVKNFETIEELRQILCVERNIRLFFDRAAAMVKKEREEKGEREARIYALFSEKDED